MYSIVTNEKYYEVIHENGFHEIIRRDVYWDTNWKDPKQIARCKEIESYLKVGG